MSRTDSTRYVDTLTGPRRYTELAPDLARAVEEVCAHLAQAEPSSLVVTLDWVCGLHRDAFGRLVSWAGKLRDRNVQIGNHEAPAFYEVPVLLRDYCGDVEARLSSYTEPLPDQRLIADLAFAEGHFLFIHPFRDFNGRTARMLLFALLVRLNLPPVDLIPSTAGKRRQYLAASRADNHDYGPLEAIWAERLR